jgi:O-glycosyl hydrolase
MGHRAVIAWLWTLLLFAPALTLADSGRIMPRPAQTFRGWGMSLAWEANDLYGGGRQPARIKDPDIQGRYMDLLYGNPATRLTLGFNVARYNIAGGDDPTHEHMRADAQMEGFQSGPGAAFDWTRDGPQRRMLQEAKRRGATIFEAFSNSPPYWMTVSGCASGASVGREDNLRPGMYGSFVNYLATVVRHFQAVEGVRFESLEAFNEPDSIWWAAGGHQEGNGAAYSTQNALIPMLAGRLKQDGLSTFVSGVDMNNIDAAVGGLRRLNPAALSALGRLNTHDYHTNPNPQQLRQYRSLAQKLHKPVWMSELGCCYHAQGDGTDIWGALFMADSVRMDLRNLGAEAWVLWQPNWNVIAFDPAGAMPLPKKQFYALAQYTRFIRPGFRIISAGGADNTLAAYSPSSKRLVLVSTNWDAVTPNDLDLSAFANIPSSAAIYRTTADEAVSLHEGSIELSAPGHLLDQLPVRSITTYVIDGVSPLPTPPADQRTAPGSASHTAGSSAPSTQTTWARGDRFCRRARRTSASIWASPSGRTLQWAPSLKWHSRKAGLRKRDTSSGRPFATGRGAEILRFHSIDPTPAEGAFLRRPSCSVI